MQNAFNKGITRSIARSVGRFAAIAIISLLGAGFYAGLRMAAPDMRIAGDDFFDGTRMYDVAVMTTLGLDEDNVEALRDVSGLSSVMPAYKADAMVRVDENSYAACVESFPVDAARASDSSDGATVRSDDDDYLNRLILKEGAWPAGSDECVIGFDAAQEFGIAAGDVITIEKSTEDLDAVFAQTSFTVAGLVNSPAYAQTGQLGATTLGTGMIERYLYVDAAAFADDLPYSVAYFTVPAAFDSVWDTEAYDREEAGVQQRIDEAAREAGLLRWHTVKEDAQSELDDARADYQRERADAEGQLADAQRKLDDARAQLDSASAQLAQGGVELADGARTLEEGETQLRAAEADYQSGKAELEEGRAALEPQLANLDTLKAQRVQLASGVAEAKAGVTALEQLLAQAREAGAPEEQIAALEQQLAQAKATLQQLEGQLAQLDAGIAQIESGKADLDAAQAQLEAARAQLDAHWAQLNEGRRQYEASAAQYRSGVADYNEGEAEYASGRAEYEENRDTAAREFADAEAELADAQKDIDDIEQPDVFVLNRQKNYGAAQLSSDAEGISQIATFLPFMFFLVAALVSLTSMTRMVDEERLDIGTHKALGYSRGRITSKYLIYGVLASGVGSVLGVMVLGQVLPWFIMTSYQVTYAVPTAPTPINPGIAFEAIGLSVGITAVATWGAAAASLREKPAALMLPRVPKAGKRIILERIKPLWRRMSFSHKVTARNLMRYKRRFFMAVVGIAGCTALLMVGFDLRDAIGGIVASQYGQLVNYDAVVRVDDDAAESAVSRVNEVLESDKVKSALQVDDFNMVATGSDDEMRIEVVVPKDEAQLSDYITLRDRVSGQVLTLEEGQLILTEKAATTLGLQAGDAVTLFDENEVGDATGEGYQFTVGGIAENYLGHFAYMLPSQYRETFGEAPAYEQYFVKLAADADPGAFADELLSIEGVSTVSFVSDKMSTYQDMLDLMGSIIFVVILLSAALAFVVLYNLTNINIAERVREIATLKVLGFTRGEVNAYIFREIIVMAVIGALAGCVLGVPLAHYIADAAETPYMMFGRVIEPLSYALSFVITMAFTIIVTITMRNKLSRVNMVESLKSVE